MSSPIEIHVESSATDILESSRSISKTDERLPNAEETESFNSKGGQVSLTGTLQPRPNASSDDNLLQRLVQSRIPVSKSISSSTVTTQTSITSSQQSKFESNFFCEGIYSLPDEILSLIFACARGRHEVRDDDYIYRTPEIILSMVSRRFRRVTLGTPVLWTYLMNGKGLKTKTYLNRSGKAGLSIKIFVRYHRYDLDIISIIPFLNIVAPHAYRWEEFVMYVSEESWFKNNPVGQFPELSLPSLMSMDLIVSDGVRECYSLLDDYSDDPFLLGNWNMPKLRHLNVDGFAPVSVPISTATSLMVFWDSFQTHEDLEAFLNFFQSNSDLRSLRWTLREFKVSGKFYQDKPDMLACIRLPNLTHLSLDIYTECILEHVKDMMDLPMLESLKMNLRMDLYEWSHDDSTFEKEELLYDENEELEETRRWFSFINDKDCDHFTRVKDISINIIRSQHYAGPRLSFFLYDVLCRCQSLEHLHVRCPSFRLVSRKDRTGKDARNWQQTPLPLRTVTVECGNHLDGQFLEMIKTALGVGDPDASAPVEKNATLESLEIRVRATSSHRSLLQQRRRREETDMPPRPIAAMKAAHQSTPYSLELLTEYGHTLDAMPLDLSRIFADLRELDAVLTSTVSSVTGKIYRLAEMIENKSASNEQRLWLLGEIAEEAGKVRPGADDKIRLATQAADSLRLQKMHLATLVTHLPEFEPAMLVPKTRYPHVSLRAYMPSHAYETGRRRRAPASGGLMGLGEGSPQKKRRVVQEDDPDYGAASKSPRKEKTGDGNAQTRPPRGPRTKKVDRHPSPPESLHSVTSHMLAHALGNGQRNNQTNPHRSTQNASSSSKRRTNISNSNAMHADNSLLDTVISRKDNQHLAPSSSTSHPSLMEAADHGASGNDQDNRHGHSNSVRSGNHNGDVKNGAQRQLEGPGVPGARASTQSSLTTNLNSTMEGSPAPAGAAATPATAGGDGAEGDADADNDDGKIYCFCDNVSYGEMIGCDQPGCEREWFHLVCIGLSEAPKGLWYCDDCVAKRKKQNARNGKKRTGGGRNNARNGL
ncbi:hypothetical protein EW145_g7188 [Phellinidium pouzarii]|uniref:Chromatin modification-related protein n=1 Tax=Phellinidium pouzarii TaxID=167371 RepID=A0A4S4KNG7_9AGAM|nr:hypothetical protein EW145_g7188 [Phellinidium pouzarii]